jgi:NADH:ubiquinone oxidoreductase subunit E
MLEVKVCVGTNCSFQGGLDILEYLENEESLEGKIQVSTSNCMNKVCRNGNSPVVMVGDEVILKAALDKVLVKIGEKIS